MRFWVLGLRALALGLAGAILASCGAQSGSQNAAIPRGVSAQSRAHKASGSYGDLVYAITSNGIVIVSYPAWSLVAKIAGYRTWYSICSDPNNGNVFAIATDNNEIDEYAHGGTTPIATLTLPSGYPTTCSVDPTTGNLAVVGIETPKELASSLFVYPQAQGNPTVYFDKQLPSLISPTYDNMGNLFISAKDKPGGSRIAELKVGHDQFTEIKLIGHRDLYLQDIQWDGTYLVYLVPNGRGYGTTVNQLLVSGKTATIANSFLLNNCADEYFWIYNGALLSFYYPPKHDDNFAIAAWPYPMGGKPASKFYAGKEHYTYDLTVSVGASR